MRKFKLLISLWLITIGVMAQQFDANALYRIKTADNKYVTIGDNSAHAFGNVYVTDLMESSLDQQFQIISSSDGKFKIKSAAGEYFAMNGSGSGWNVNSTTAESQAMNIIFAVDGDGYNLRKDNNTYFKVDPVSDGSSPYKHVYHDGGSGNRAKFYVEKIEEESGVVITSVANLSNDKVYTIKSKDYALRGFMYSPETGNALDFAGGSYTDRNGAPAYNNVSYNPEDKKQQFTIVKHNDKYYLYSLAKGKFAADSGEINELKDEATDNNIEITYNASTSSFSMKFVSTNNYITDAPGWYSRGTCFITTNTSISDDGDRFIITEVGDMQPADKSALALKLIGFNTAEFDQSYSTLVDYLNLSTKNNPSNPTEILGTVGYPAPNSPAVETVSNLVNEIGRKGYGNESYVYNMDDYNAVVAALDTYEAETDVKMPESGKAYRIKAKYYNGSFKYMYRTNAGKMKVDPSVPSGYEGTFIFRKNDDGTYAVVNNYGEYMTYYADGKTGVGGTNDGFAPQYENGNYNADMKFIIAVDKTPTSGTKDSWLGGFLIQGRNTSGDGGNNYYYLMAGPNSDFHNAGVNDIFYSSGNLTSVFYLEEVEYPNNVTLASFEGSQLIRNLEGNTIGTFSAPFPTVLPTGVTAYYAHQNTGELISLTEVETAAIPANQGVILVGTTAETTKALMVPATSEQPANLSSNLFQNSAGRKAGMEEGDFILARGSQGIGFYPVNIDNSNGTEGTTLAMNKAFLRMGTSNVAAFRLVVDEEVTAIDGVTTEKADAPIYDLSGRRVLNTIKGGIYIQNGKKFIVK